MGVSSSPSYKIICSFLVHFVLLLGIETFNVNDDMIYKWVRLMQILTLVALMWACLLHTTIRPFIYFYYITRIDGYRHFQCKWRYDFQVCQLSVNTNVGCFDVGMSSSPSNKTICSFLVPFLLLLAIETFNVNDDMIFKCVCHLSGNTNVGCIDVDVSSAPSNKTICFFNTFPLVAARIWSSSVAV